MHREREREKAGIQKLLYNMQLLVYILCYQTPSKIFFPAFILCNFREVKILNFNIIFIIQAFLSLYLPQYPIFPLTACLFNKHFFLPKC